MTGNQINYARLKEEQRSNKAKESENQRHNLVTESLQNQSNWILGEHYSKSDAINAIAQQETERSNRAREAETERSNRAKEAENRRHNITSEQLGFIQAKTQAGNLIEQSRHNIESEAISTEANRIAQVNANTSFLTGIQNAESNAQQAEAAQQRADNETSRVKVQNFTDVADIAIDALKTPSEIMKNIGMGLQSTMNSVTKGAGMLGGLLR